jgi:nitroimidazol reductase NimA-like FMN-containing flavoprotein (pyridoxamine 5'-phosphate oxidase superfamily)
VRRAPDRGIYDRATIDAILDEALVAHVGFVHDGQPFVIPTLHARVGDEVYLHLSTASRLVRRLAEGVPCCLTVTLLDGLVLARAAFLHSANYRSAVVLGSVRVVETEAEKLRALEAFTEHLVPGRWGEIKMPTRQELKGTQVLALPLEEASAKIRTGPPLDEEEDLGLGVWAGEIPLVLEAQAPRADPRSPREVPVPGHVAGWALERRLRHTASRGADIARDRGLTARTAQTPP